MIERRTVYVPVCDGCGESNRFAPDDLDYAAETTIEGAEGVVEACEGVVDPDGKVFCIDCDFKRQEGDGPYAVVAE